MAWGRTGRTSHWFRCRIQYISFDSEIFEFFLLNELSPMLRGTAPATVSRPALRAANAHYFATETAAGTTGRVLVAAFLAIESQTQCVDLLGRAPATFWCARATVPSTQANASLGSTPTTAWAMILADTPLTAQQRNLK